MYKIVVLMSTYNGDKYIREQLNSIFNQINCEIMLVVRDDGSSDNTIKILHEYKNKYPNHVQLIEGKNEGYRKSFMSLLSFEYDCDYYCFADQDDVWLNNKCIEAIKKIDQLNLNCNVLYASSVKIATSMLDIVSVNDITTSPNTIKSYFIRHRLAGCTMMFDKGIHDIAKKIVELGVTNDYIDHDFLIGTIAYTYGTVIRDKNSYIIHRRSNDSVTSGGKGFFNRLQTEYFLIFKRKNINYCISNMILDYSKKNNIKCTAEVEKFLNDIALYKNSRSSRKELFSDKTFTSNIKVCDIEAKIKIILKNF